MRKARLTSATLIAGLALVFAAPAMGEPAAGVSLNGDILLTFDTTAPGVMTGHSISGLQPGETIRGIDVRPATGVLYGIGVTPTAGDDVGRLYTLNPATGAATAVGGTPFSTTLGPGLDYGFDFDPVADTARLVDEFDQNLQLSPVTGSPISTDTNLDNPTNDEEVVALAYDRNVAGTAATTLFGIDFVNDTLVRVGGVDGTPNPSLGALTEIGPIGFTTGSQNIGFDITPAGAALATALDSGSNLWSLYSVDLTTGALTPTNALGAALGGFAVLPPAAAPPPAIETKKCKKKKGKRGNKKAAVAKKKKKKKCRKGKRKKKD